MVKRQARGRALAMTVLVTFGVISIIGCFIYLGWWLAKCHKQEILVANAPDEVDVGDADDTLFGWTEPTPAQHEDMTRKLPRLVFAAGVDNTRKNVRLWDRLRAVNGGRDWANTPQQTGDCTSWSVRNAILASQGYANVSNPRAPFPPWLYGTGRVTVGKGEIRCREQGAVLGWVVKAATDYGIVYDDELGVPQYGGKLADKWGCDGPPKTLNELAKQSKAMHGARLLSAGDVRDAICSGYGVAFGSMYGTKTFRKTDSRYVANGDAQWPHAMAIIAYDGTASTPYVFFLNSWGEGWGPQPLQQEPKGGMWVRLSEVEKQMRDRNFTEAYAVGDASGFDLEIDFLKPRN